MHTHICNYYSYLTHLYPGTYMDKVVARLDKESVASKELVQLTGPL